MAKPFRLWLSRVRSTTTGSIRTCSATLSKWFQECRSTSSSRRAFSTPLKMSDTFFVVPPEKKSRVAKTYAYKDGKLAETGFEELRAAQAVPFGGMGLYSTIRRLRAVSARCS